MEPGDFSKGAVIVVSNDQSVVFQILTDLSSDYSRCERMEISKGWKTNLCRKVLANGIPTDTFDKALMLIQPS